MEIEIVSKESIKPSSPTPPHLREYKLSLLDQFIPSIYVPIVLFYPMVTDHHLITKRTNLLKQSLSKALTQFYPLAGKIKDNLTIECNDEGAYFAVAQVKAHMFDDFLNQPHLALIQRFLPREATWNESNTGFHVAMFQVNIFDCGGIAIAAFISHMIADGIAASSFLKSWAATACGSCEAEFPSFNSPSLFPRNESMAKELTLVAMLSPFFKAGKSVTRRFVFNSSAIAMLKPKASSSCGQIPTRVQAVSALLWKSFIATCTAKSGAQKPSVAIHSVNMRRRASPPLSESCMGNFLWLAVAQCKAESGIGLHQLAGGFKEAITKVDANLVKKFEGEEGFIKYRESLKEMSKEIDKESDCLVFTSWYNFGLYEVDFGWGKPAWTTSAGSGDSASVHLNTIVLMETKSGDGMEAWVTLDEQDMAIFQCDRELMSFASVDQSPLSLGNWFLPHEQHSFQVKIVST